MLVFGLKACHFVVWASKLCYAVVVSYDESFAENIQKLVTFYEKYILEELVTRKLEYDQPEDKENIELFCYWQKPYNVSEDMIGCDNINCKYKWIHFKCANIKRPRKGQSWYCKYCKK